MLTSRHHRKQGYIELMGSLPPLLVHVVIECPHTTLNPLTLFLPLRYILVPTTGYFVLCPQIWLIGHMITTL